MASLLNSLGIPDLFELPPLLRLLRGQRLCCGVLGGWGHLQVDLVFKWSRYKLGTTTLKGMSTSSLSLKIDNRFVSFEHETTV